MKVNSSVSISNEELEALEITDIAELEIGFQVKTSDYQDYLTTDPVKIKTSALFPQDGEQRRHKSDTLGAGKYRSHEIRNFQELSRGQQDRYRRYHNGQLPIEHRQQKLLQLYRSVEAHHQLQLNLKGKV